VKLAALSIIAAAAVACGGSAGPCPSTASFSPAPQLALASNSGVLNLAVSTSPAPLARGVNELRYDVTDSTGKPVSGLNVAVTPWMPYMGHGSSVVPSVAEQSGGSYLVTCVDITMPGTWQLRTTFSGPVSDDATPTFQVQ
jgi:hypothetical protein